jgi:hypothetical protein
VPKATEAQPASDESIGKGETAAGEVRAH